MRWLTRSVIVSVVLCSTALSTAHAEGPATEPCLETDAGCLLDRLTEQVIRAETAEKRLDASQKALRTSEEMRAAAEKRADKAEARDDRLPWFLGGIGVAIVAGLTGALLAK